MMTNAGVQPLAGAPPPRRFESGNPLTEARGQDLFGWNSDVVYLKGSFTVPPSFFRSLAVAVGITPLTSHVLFPIRFSPIKSGSAFGPRPLSGGAVVGAEGGGHHVAAGAVFRCGPSLSFFELNPSPPPPRIWCPGFPGSERRGNGAKGVTRSGVRKLRTVFDLKRLFMVHPSGGNTFSD